MNQIAINLSAEHARSYYNASANVMLQHPTLTSDLQADVCVIGGGFTGVNTAIELAQRGLSVILLEGRKIGWGASGRNGGQLIRGIGHDVSALPVTSARKACAIWSAPVSNRSR